MVVLILFTIAFSFDLVLHLKKHSVLIFFLLPEIFLAFTNFLFQLFKPLQNLQKKH